MTCEQCQQLMSVFLDNELEGQESLSVQMHLAECAGCAATCEDLTSILDFCGESPGDVSIPPNSNALWCRINNIIETEVSAELAKEAKVEEEQRTGFWVGGWNFSFSQVAVSIIGIALISSLLTFIGIRNLSTPAERYTAEGTAEISIFEKVLGKLGIVETPQQAREHSIKERLTAIDYWNKRIEDRKQHWDAQLRDAFERNVKEIDRTVFEYEKTLQENPDDDLSGEMLDTTLNEKVELLREFSDL